MNYVLAITTYNRKEYLLQLLKSFVEFTDLKANQWRLVIHSDSLERFPRNFFPKEIESIYLIQSDRIGVHKGTNKLLHYSAGLNFDYGFKVDDDIFFKKQGWESLYQNKSIQTGYHHLSYKNTNWNNYNSGSEVFRSMGCFWTFTPKVIEKVGYFDSVNMGFRGIGHLDYSARCCRAGFNNAKNFLDAPGSNDFIGIHSGESYKPSLSQSEVLEHRKNQGLKMQIAADESRIYIPLQ